MLGEAVDKQHERAVQAGPADEHDRQPGPQHDRRRNGGGIDSQVDPGGPVNLVPLGLRDVVGLVGGEPPGRVREHQPEGSRHVGQAGEVHDQPRQPRGTHRRDLGIPPDDQRVRVVAGVAPPPGGRVAHDHEGGELVQPLVKPARLERRAVAGLVPAGIRRRAVEHAVGEEERHRKPAAPERDAKAGEGDHQPDPDHGVPDGPAIGAPHQLFHPLARHRAAEPVAASEAGVNRRLILRPGEAVPLQPLPAHSRSPLRAECPRLPAAGPDRRGDPPHP